MYTYRIEYDQDAPNPRDEFDNLSTFYAVKNPRYMSGGKKDIEYTYRDDLDDEIKALRKAGAVIVEFSHNCGNQYAVVDEDTLKREYPGYSSRKAKYHARRVANGEIETWKAWANGEVYGYIVEDEDGNRLDSCWGYYGDDGHKEAEREAQGIIEWYQKKDAEEAALLERRIMDQARG